MNFSLNSLFKFKGYTVDNISNEQDKVQVTLQLDKRTQPQCPHCNKAVAINKTTYSKAKDLSLIDTPVEISFPITQGFCKNCGKYVSIRPEEIHPQKHATWRFMETLSTWAFSCPARQVAQQYNVSDNTVRNYDLEVLKRDMPPVNLDHLRAILIDEKAVRKKHNYVTVVLNADTGEMLYMEEGKKKETLDAFFEQMTAEQKANIQAVGIDRAGAYQSSVEAHLPNAEIVYDRFHLMLNINAAVDEVRRKEWRESNDEEKKVIKGSRFLILANEENLDDKGKEKLEKLNALNESVCTAYQLKEQFRALFTVGCIMTAVSMLKSWSEMAEASNLEPFQRLGKSLLKQKEKVCGFIKHKLTSGKIECFNNQVARVIHRACGVTNLEYLRLKLRQISLRNQPVT